MPRLSALLGRYRGHGGLGGFGGDLVHHVLEVIVRLLLVDPVLGRMGAVVVGTGVAASANADAATTGEEQHGRAGGEDKEDGFHGRVRFRVSVEKKDCAACLGL